MALKKELSEQGSILFKYRGHLPIILLISGLIVFYFYTTNLIKSIDIDYRTYYEIFCVFVSFLGFYIRALVIGTVPKNTSGRNTKSQVADTLNTSGIYSLLRHPLYLGNLFLWLGPVLYIHSAVFFIIFILVYWLYYERIMFTEESFLIDKFGDDYLNWSKYTPAFIPNFKNYTPSELDFSFKNVIKREYYIFPKLFLIFFAFDLLKEIKVDEEINLLNSWQDYSFYISILIFIIVRYLAKKTDILNVKGR